MLLLQNVERPRVELDGPILTRLRSILVACLPILILPCAMSQSVARSAISSEGLISLRRWRLDTILTPDLRRDDLTGLRLTMRIGDRRVLEFPDDAPRGAPAQGD